MKWRSCSIGEGPRCIVNTVKLSLSHSSGCCILGKNNQTFQSLLNADSELTLILGSQHHCGSPVRVGVYGADNCSLSSGPSHCGPNGPLHQSCDYFLSSGIHNWNGLYNLQNPQNGSLTSVAQHLPLAGSPRCLTISCTSALSTLPLPTQVPTPLFPGSTSGLLPLSKGRPS